MKIDLSCPVELWKYVMPSESYPACVLTLYNLSEKTVVSVQVTIILYAQDGSLVTRRTERAQGISGESKAGFDVAIGLEPDLEFADLEVHIEKVWFYDGTIWRRLPSSTVEYTPNALPIGRELEELRFVAGADALGYPHQEGAVWLCVCGRPNAAKDEECVRCGRLKENVMQEFSQEGVASAVKAHEEALAVKARRAREDAGKLQEKLQDEQKRRRRVRRIVIGSVAGALLVAGSGYCIWRYGVPAYKYYMAGQNLNNGDYAAARQEFEALGSYRAAQELVKKCDYQAADAMLKEGTSESLLSAQTLFEELADYEDSAVKAQEAKYRRAQILISLSKYSDAAELLGEISGYGNARELLSQTRYSWAESLKAQERYEAAREIYLMLGDYEDSAEKASECLYIPGTAALAEGRYEEAIKYLEQIPDFTDASTQTQSAYFQLGMSRFGRGEMISAAEAFGKAGSSADVQTMLNRCLYDPAIAAMKDGDYQAAADMFEQILDYGDAGEKYLECRYETALSEQRAKAYERAHEVFAELGDYSDSAYQAEYSLFLAAEAATDAENLDAAIVYLERIPNFEGAAEKLTEAKYLRGLSLLEEKKYKDAGEQFAELSGAWNSAAKEQEAFEAYAAELVAAGQEGDALAYFSKRTDDVSAAISSGLMRTYADKLMSESKYTDAIAYFSARDDDESKAILASVVSAYGQNLIDNKNYDEAITFFAGKDDDESVLFVKKAQYGQGQSFLSDGDYTSARYIFDKLADFMDSEAQVNECDYQLAAKMLEDGDSEGALKAFTALGDYKDSIDKVNEIRYQEAMSYYSAGDVSNAGSLFSQLGEYKDSADKAIECYDSFLVGIKSRTDELMAKEDYKGIIDLLSGIDLSDVPGKYSSLLIQKDKAIYSYAEQLYRDKDIFEAYKYYKQIPDYGDVADKKLTRRCYQLFGSWKGVNMTAEFREDGSCVIDGVEYQFGVQSYGLLLGATRDDMKAIYSIAYVGKSSLTLRNNNSSRDFKMQKVTEE
ncbi:MAG: hypothetical protein PHI27_13130 [Eubacteriales bacterium]|nr:hypothetical protein [Eubacteriales bacterium]MDD3883166.1 hypothetical protein [Eubacteriales bacterium]MDD4512451.1 hypothetical protein [Eubacteriales bacterium]